MKDRREYAKPIVTKVTIQPDETVMTACKPDMITCFKIMTNWGS